MEDYIEFKNIGGCNYIVTFPILNSEKPLVLRLWVAYDLGGYSPEGYEVKRGYYLYISFEEPVYDYPTRILTEEYRNTRILLGEVKRKSESACHEYSQKAGKYAKRLVEMLFKDLDIDWDNGYDSYWDGRDSGIGMYKWHYSIPRFHLSPTA